MRHFIDIIKKLLLLVLLVVFVVDLQAQETVSLNGQWLMGEGRCYAQTVNVPGVHTDPTRMNSDTLWYKCTMTMPRGKWTHSTLELKGARFAPAVYVDGRLVARSGGGMAPTFFDLGKVLKPGRSHTIEIALTSLAQLPKNDASYIPETDHWRSNLASCLWDDVLLHLHGGQRVTNVIIDADTDRKNMKLDFFVEGETGKEQGSYELSIATKDGDVIYTRQGRYVIGKNTIDIDYEHILEEWSPEHPNVYKLGIMLRQGKKTIDRMTRRLGVKRFEVRGDQFFLNGKPCKLRGGSVPLHRWMRTPDGQHFTYEGTAFEENIIRRLKEHGANEVNFHLGLATNRILDLCDDYGLLVRYEWPFFHGMQATRESCYEQYKRWIESSTEHPCAAFYYPYNETAGESLKKAWSALNEVLKDYPSWTVVSYRDVDHLHKYWWSMFENLGLQYDDKTKFKGRCVMADEFGGNYLDRNGDYGGYPIVKEGFLRMLGHDNTREQRLNQLSLSCGKVGEYWRRLDIAGWTPYTQLSSFEDGNDWFLGRFEDCQPMPVWQAMTAVWSPQAASLELWDVNFTPGQQLRIPLYTFNDLDEHKALQTIVTLTDNFGKIYFDQTVTRQLAPFTHAIDTITLTIPEKVGDYTLRAELMNRPEGVCYPVVSQWDVRTFSAVVPEKVRQARVYVPAEEQELRQFVAAQGLTLDEKKADIVLCGSKTWNTEPVEEHLKEGRSVIMLDVDVPLKKGETKDVALFGSLSLRFRQATEPETHFFPDVQDSTLFAHLPHDYRGMWNGMRGQLVMPAREVELIGVNADIFLDQWEARGADRQLIESGSPYYAYEKYGYYKFSTRPNDSEAEQALLAYVDQVMLDAPSLAIFVNPKEKVKQTDVAAGFRTAAQGMARSLRRMANAGKNLTRVPVQMIDFVSNRPDSEAGHGSYQGRLLISQLCTRGRLAPPTAPSSSLYAPRYDETAVQMVLNMIDLALK